MKHTSSVYWVEAKEGNNPEQVVAHTKRGKKFYHEFLDRKRATNLLNSEKETTAGVKYRICKKTITIDFEKWQ
jgi:hypothetical protein